MAKTAEETYVQEQIREAEKKPTWTELLEKTRQRPGFKPYTGPSSAAIVRTERDKR